MPVLYDLYTKNELYVGGIPQIMECHKSTTPCLVGTKYTNPYPFEKLLMVADLKPEILILGTSRVMQFRHQFFKNKSFYNAGGGIKSLPEIKRFLNDKRIQNYSPKILILGLDQNFFNYNWDKVEGEPLDFDEKQNIDYSSMRYLISQILPGILRDIYNRKVNYASFFEKTINDGINRIGYTAHWDQSGFLNDGSYHYGVALRDQMKSTYYDYKFKQTYERINNSSDGFEYGTEINANALKLLDEILTLCKKRGIEVIGFLPPYADEILNYMLQFNENYEYIRKLPGELISIFAKHKFTFLDATSNSSLGSALSEVTDGYHGSEKSYVRLLMKLIKTNKTLEANSQSLSYFQDKINNSKNDLYLFDINE